MQFRRLVFEFSCLTENCLVTKKGLQKNKGKEEKKREKERGTEKKNKIRPTFNPHSLPDVTKVLQQFREFF